MKKISVIFGTRPETIKLAPIILALRKQRSLRCHVCVTAQHRHMLDQVLSVFAIKPDVDLNLMRPGQTLAEFTARAVTAVDAYLANYKPDLVLVQGDTTTVFCATLAAFYQNIPVGHVEAGLRTWNMAAPWPEEANRVLTSRLATLHFAPTIGSRDNLRREGIPASRIFVTGNPVIDALKLALREIKRSAPIISGLPEFLQHGSPDAVGSRMVLITGHRRENFGAGFENICKAIAALANHFPQVHFVYPMHLNPGVREPVNRILRPRTSRSLCGQVSNIHLIEPLEYLPFVALMDRAHLVLTDSGGVQEEAPAMGKPVLVMRDVTERPEAVKAGVVELIGTQSSSIYAGVSRLLCDKKVYARMSRGVSPYGDGLATDRILAVVKFFLAHR